MPEANKMYINPSLVVPDKTKYKKLTNKTGRRFCDELWTTCVKIRYNHICAICGSDFMVNAHHLVSKRVTAYRWVVNNGIALCPSHHKFDLHISAHTAPWGFEEWMREHRLIDWGDWVKRRQNIVEDFDFVYDEVYRRLENEHWQLTGEYFRIARIDNYMLALHRNQVEEEYEKSHSVQAIADKFGFGKTAVSDFLKRNRIVKTATSNRKTTTSRQKGQKPS